MKLKILLGIGCLFFITNFLFGQCNNGSFITFLNNNFIWDIHTSGQIDNGTNDAYDEYQILNVNGVGFIDNTPTTEAAGRQYVFTSTITGIDVTRVFYAPTTGDWARWVDVFSNPTASPINVNIEYLGELGSNGSTNNWGSSSGDLVFGTDDFWLGTDDSNGFGDPTLTHHIQGPGATITPSSVLNLSGFTPCGGGQDNYQVFYNFTLNPGETIALLSFGGQHTNQTTALTSAQDILTNVPMQTGPYLEFLDNTTINQIQNWDLGSTVTAAIPTMSEWGFFLFGLILFTLGIVALYNQKYQIRSKQ